MTSPLKPAVDGARMTEDHWRRQAEAAQKNFALLQQDCARHVAEKNVLRAALRPFAQHLDEMKFDKDNYGNDLPDEQAVGWVYVTNGDFRRARIALSTLIAPEKESE